MVGFCYGGHVPVIIIDVFFVVVSDIIMIVTCGPTSNVGGGEINCASILPLVQIFIIS